MPRSNLTLEQRFWAKVNKTDTCWLWTAFTTKKGYGKLQVGKQSKYAYRFAYELLVGPIPEGLQLDHLCHGWDTECKGGSSCLHRSCVNPNHLEPVTLQENVRRSDVGSNFRGRPTCVNGHPFSGTNLQFAEGRRICRQCGRDRAREYATRKRRENGVPLRSSVREP